MQDVNKQLLERWAAFGKAMQKAGSELPRHLIADTEQAISAAEQAQQATAQGCSFTDRAEIGVRAGSQQQAEPVAADPAVAAIHFALETHSDGLHFLRLWNEGEFDLLRREWPEAPKDIYIGADPRLEVPAQPPAGALPLALPEWTECDDKVQAGTANALERFIYANEPAGDSAAEFRAGLLSMLVAAKKGGQ